MSRTHTSSRLGVSKNDQPYAKSPLSQQVEFQPARPSFDEEEYDRNAITFSNSLKPAHFGLLPDAPPYTPTWTEQPAQQRPPHKRHRRIDTATLIAMATKPHLTPHRILSLFAVVCAASYLARLLPLLVSPSWQDPRYNAGTLHRPAAVFEALSFGPSAGAVRRVQNARAAVRRPVPSDDAEAGTHPAARMRVIRPMGQIQKPVRRPDNWRLPPVEQAYSPDDALDGPAAHDHTLNVVVLDGLDRAQHQEVEAMERTEAGLRDADDGDDDERKSFERIMMDLGQEEDDAESAEDWLEEELQGDENEDVPLVAEVSEADEELARQLPMPMRAVRGRPVSEYLAQRTEAEEHETLFEGET